MNNIIKIGWSHHHSNIKFRELLTLNIKEINICINGVKECYDIKEIVVLSTCNRIEFYAISDNVDSLLQYIYKFYKIYLNRKINFDISQPKILYNQIAIQHLCKVAAGMDSMVLWEKQILNQVLA